MKQKVTTTKAPGAPGLLSQAIVYNGFIYVSGQIHSTTDGVVVQGSAEEKTHQVIKNIASILQAAGADLNDVIKATIYVTDISDLPKLNEVYKTYFAEPLPAREAVCVKALPLGASIEMSVVAFVK
jgi:2-iminobutanoate/2-iminopropanoate deaminase